MRTTASPTATKSRAATWPWLWTLFLGGVLCLPLRLAANVLLYYPFTLVLKRKANEALERHGIRV